MPDSDPWCVLRTDLEELREEADHLERMFGSGATLRLRATIDCLERHVSTYVS